MELWVVNLSLDSVKNVEILEYATSEASAQKPKPTLLLSHVLTAASEDGVHGATEGMLAAFEKQQFVKDYVEPCRYLLQSAGVSVKFNAVKCSHWEQGVTKIASICGATRVYVSADKGMRIITKTKPMKACAALLPESVLVVCVGGTKKLAEQKGTGTAAATLRKMDNSNSRRSNGSSEEDMLIRSQSLASTDSFKSCSSSNNSFISTSSSNNSFISTSSNGSSN